MGKHDTTGRRPVQIFGWDRKGQSVYPENGSMEVGNVGRGKVSQIGSRLTSYQCNFLDRSSP